MRPPTSIHLSKNRFRNLIIVIGLFSGILITALIWLKVPTQITTSLSWLSLGLIGLGSFLYLRRPATPLLRWVTILAVLAAIALVYLFPEMFRPVCGGMPRAFASPSTRCGVCLNHVCEWSNKTHSMHCYCDEWDNSGCTPTDPPSIDAELTCDLWGDDSWCAGSLTLDLTATEPQGQEVMISGEVGGTAFACPASLATSTCSVPLPEGKGSTSYTATSASGLTASGSSSYQHDSVQPQIDGWLNGTSGNNGWFISSVNVNASVSDPAPASGIAAFEYNLDNSGWESFTGSLSLLDGVYGLSLRASDVAGNLVETDQTIQIDTITPALDISVNGTVGANGWYTSAVQISVSASDSGSGVNSVEYDLDSAGWAAYSEPLDFSDGIHSLSLRVIDNAGNITEGTQAFSVDTFAPVIDFSLAGTEGANGWYTATVQVGASANDTGSGLATIEVSVDGGNWNTYSAPLMFDDGLHTYQFRATDQAGNLSKTALQQVQVDTVPPAIDLPESWKLGQATIFKLEDDGSGLSSVRLVIEDDDERYPKVTWDESLGSYKFKGEIDWNGHFKDGQLAPPGDGYYAWLKVSDHAGNESMLAGQIIVPVGNFVGELIQPSDDQTAGLVSGAEASDPVVEPPVPSASTADESPASQPPTVNTPPTINFGGIGNGAAQPSAAQTGKTSFNAGGVSNSPITNSQSNILWGATATAAIGAFVAEITRRKEAEQAARRAANVAKNQRLMQIAAAYQASVTNFKATLNQARRLGLSETDATKLKENVLKTGKIGAALGAAKDFVTQTVAAINASKQFTRFTRMEEKLEAGAQAYGNLPQGYEGYNDAKQEVYEAFRAEEVAAQTENNLPKDEKTRFESWLEGKIAQAALSPRLGRYGSGAVNQTDGDYLRSIGDPNRNPRTAAANKQMWEGITAWEAIFEMRKETKKYTTKAIKEGNWNNAFRGMSALAKQNLTVAGGTVAAAGIAVWGVISTPVRIFTQDIPEFFQSGKERREGKDRYWDVIFTGSNLIGDVTALYGGYQAAGKINLVNKINSIGADYFDIGIIKRPYTFEGIEYTYRYNPYKRAALGYLEDLEGLTPEEYNLLKDIPDEIYAKTSIQSDFLKDISESKIKPRYFSDPELYDDRVFSYIENKYFEELISTHPDWWETTFGAWWKSVFNGSISPSIRS